ncbi:MAG: hypothetical protein WDN50_24410 [Bradyrhizobium sp.]
MLTTMLISENQIMPQRRPIRSVSNNPISEPSGPPAKISTESPSELATPWPCFTRKVGTQLTKVKLNVSRQTVDNGCGQGFGAAAPARTNRAARNASVRSPGARHLLEHLRLGLRLAHDRVRFLEDAPGLPASAAIPASRGAGTRR